MTTPQSPGERSRGTRQRVFISHGSKDSHYSWLVCDDIREALSKAGYEVFLDRRSLHPQDDWRRQIGRQLESCHAAVFVIAERALDREWVRREAEILRHRHDICGIFLLVVLLDDLQPEDLEAAGLGVLNIKQALKFGAQAEAEPTRIAEDVVEEFAELPALPGEDEPMRLWAERLSAKLGRSADPGLLEDAAKLLGLEERDARRARGFNGARFLARSLLNAGLGDNVPRAVFHLNAALGSTGRSLAQEMAPTWVNEEAARCFIPDEKADEGRVLLLHASIRQTADHHIGRAMRRDVTRYVSAALNVLRPDEAEATALVEDELRAALRARMAIPDDGEWGVPVPGQHVYLVVPVESRACRRRLAAVVGEIRRHAPWLHVVALMDGGPPDEGAPARWGVEDAVVVRPALNGTQEERGHLRVHELYEAVDSQYEVPERWRTTCR
ncbi:toll/interleukin-1 receptor domain-containing protein [Streptomyces sp. ALI-76-A]|uniref:toll/interleukin-1 receptor domain-containing protein n=1 Tax=Streptomyces sp. ALI-76-A TaxID=3025736 RepID=UPI00256ECEAA|nr:toll/interleukin-1 receptor domain-containing protein [Streptomyces sp. ALI-76-A]MDL5205250.1 toll/interleukin-1 receptor domain-containing protein [Streptomyces sp. ALI-76-A]